MRDDPGGIEGGQLRATFGNGTEPSPRVMFVIERYVIRYREVRRRLHLVLQFLSIMDYDLRGGMGLVPRVAFFITQCNESFT